MASKHARLRSALTKAIVDFFIHEDLYSDELRIQGTLCVTADQNAIFVTQITETIGESYDGDVLNTPSSGDSKLQNNPASDCFTWNSRDPIDYSSPHEGRNHGGNNSSSQNSGTKPSFAAPKSTTASDSFDRLDNLTNNLQPAHSNVYGLSNTSLSSTLKVPSAGSYNTLNSPPGGDKPLPLVNNRNSNSSSSLKITSKHNIVTNSLSEIYNPNKVLNNKRSYPESNPVSISQLPSSLMQRQSSFLNEENYEDSFLSSFSPRLNESLMSPLSKKLKTEPVEKDSSKVASSKDLEDVDKPPEMPELSRAKLMELLQGVAGRVTSPPLIPREPPLSVTSPPGGDPKESKGSSPPPASMADGDNGMLSSSPQPFSPPPAHLMSDSSGFGGSFAWPLTSITSSANYNADWQMNSWVRKPKTKFTPEQLQLLETEYQLDPFLSTCADRRANLARKLNLTEKNIQIWFQNQRRRRRAAAYSRMHHMFNSTSDASGSQLPMLPPDGEKPNLECELENQRDDSDLRPTSDLEDSNPDDSPLVLDESKEPELEPTENGENVPEPSKCEVNE